MIIIFTNYFLDGHHQTVLEPALNNETDILGEVISSNDILMNECPLANGNEELIVSENIFESHDSDFSSDDTDKDPNYVPHCEDLLSTHTEPQNLLLSPVISICNTPENGNKTDSNTKAVMNTRKYRADKKIKRNTGLSYTTLKGKTVRKRCVKNLPNCRMKCNERIPEFIREQIFTEYWALGEYSKRVAYVGSLIDSMETVRPIKRTTNEVIIKNRKY